MQRLKTFLFLFLLMFAVPFLCAGTVSAARHQPVHRLNYFQSYATQVDGVDGWRIEIGLDRSDVTYEVRQKSILKKEVVIDLADTVRGDLKEHIAQNSNIVTDVSIEETAEGHTLLHLTLAPSFFETFYEICRNAVRFRRMPRTEIPRIQVNRRL